VVLVQCQKPFEEEDVIIINPTEEEAKKLREKMEARRAKLKSKNKSLKREAAANSSAEAKEAVKNKKLKTAAQTQPASSKIAEKLIKLEDPDMAKLKASYSIAKDPNASSVYKSLFTSCDKAKNQTKAHWVTYNPHWN